MLPLEICMTTHGNGISMIPSRELTGLETRMLSSTCVEKPLSLSVSSSLMACLSLELLKVRFTREPSEDNLRTLVRVDRPTDAAASLIELVTLCSTP